MAPAIALATVGAVLVAAGLLAVWKGEIDVRIIGATLLVCGLSVLAICVLAVLPMR